MMRIQIAVASFSAVFALWGTLVEDVAKLGERARKDVQDARVQMNDGTAAYPPQVGLGYGCFWLRDYAYALEGAADVIPRQELLAAAELFVSKLDGNGSGVDCIAYDGHPLYRPGGDTMGDNPVADGGPFTVAVAYLTWKQTGDASLLRKDYLDRLLLTLHAVPHNRLTGLVHISPAIAYDRAPYGFTDCVRKTGDVLFCSLLDYEACGRIAEMLREAGRVDEANAEVCRSIRIKSAINRTLWDARKGLYVAATHKCRQGDIWGSAFAVSLGVADTERAKRIAAVFKANYNGLVYYGQIRHLLPGEFWEEVAGVGAEPGRYQNGGFWGVPTGWFVRTLEYVDAELAVQTVHDFVVYGSERGYPEFIIPGENEPIARLPRYLATSCVPYSVLRNRK